MRFLSKLNTEKRKHTTSLSEQLSYLTMAEPLFFNDIKALIRGEFRLSEDELVRHFITIETLFVNQELDFYFEEVLEGAIYPNMVAEFWMNASLRIDPEGRTTIDSEIRHARLSITPTTIANLIRCNNSGETFDDNSFSMTTHLMLRTLMDNDRFSAKVIRIWHQMLVGNFQPRRIDENNIMVEDLEFILCGLRGRKINIPLMIFKGLVKAVSIGVDRRGSVTCLPYGRLLSYIFLKKGVVRRMRDSGARDMFEAESSPVLSLDNLDQRIN
jgi:hypothetical protein